MLSTIFYCRMYIVGNGTVELFGIMDTSKVINPVALAILF